MPEPLPGPPAVEFDRAAFAYGRTVVLREVTGAVPAGSALALVGPNGAGKSTLLGAVLGLVRTPSGRVGVLGRAPAAARREVAYVPQADTLDPDFPVTVERVVLMGRYRRIGWVRRPGRADRAAAAAALESVGLAHRARDRFGVLSGGQRQRVLLARAICQEPRVLALDEPFNGVDATSRRALLAALAGLRAGGATVLMSTHDLVAAQASSQVCLVGGGRAVFGPPAAVLTADRLRAAYGGHLLAAGGTLLVAS